MEMKGSVAQQRDKVLKTLLIAIPTPLHFLHAWGWFMTLVNYRYKNPSLLGAMMQFGCEVAQYDGNYRWTDCLKMYMNLARPLLRGNLEAKIYQFKNANFPLVLSKCPQVEKGRTTTAARLSGHTSASASTSTAPPPIASEEICKNWNKGMCPSPCPHLRKHGCLACTRPGHRAYQCGTPIINNTNHTQGGIQGSMPRNQAQPYQQRPFNAGGNGSGANRERGQNA